LLSKTRGRRETHRDGAPTRPACASLREVLAR
jgi:hypothetical protein